VIAHVAVLGDPTLHHKGLITERDARGELVADHLVAETHPPGSVSRLQRTSAHAKPIRFKGARLFLREFHKMSIESP
jgi:hypothetical protein